VNNTQFSLHPRWCSVFFPTRWAHLGTSIDVKSPRNSRLIQVQETGYQEEEQRVDIVVKSQYSRSWSACHKSIWFGTSGAAEKKTLQNSIHIGESETKIKSGSSSKGTRALFLDIMRIVEYSYQFVVMNRGFFPFGSELKLLAYEVRRYPSSLGVQTEGLILRRLGDRLSLWW